MTQDVLLASALIIGRSGRLSDKRDIKCLMLPGARYIIAQLVVAVTTTPSAAAPSQNNVTVLRAPQVSAWNF